MHGRGVGACLGEVVLPEGWRRASGGELVLPGDVLITSPAELQGDLRSGGLARLRAWSRKHPLGAVVVVFEDGTRRGSYGLRRGTCPGWIEPSGRGQLPRLLQALRDPLRLPGVAAHHHGIRFTGDSQADVALACLFESRDRGPSVSEAAEAASMRRTSLAHAMTAQGLAWGTLRDRRAIVLLGLLRVVGGLGWEEACERLAVPPRSMRKLIARHASGRTPMSRKHGRDELAREMRELLAEWRRADRERAARR